MSDSPINKVLPLVYHNVHSWKMISKGEENNRSDITMTQHVYLGGPTEEVIKVNGWVLNVIVGLRSMTKIQNCCDCWDITYTNLVQNNIRWRKLWFLQDFWRLHEAEQSGCVLRSIMGSKSLMYFFLYFVTVELKDNNKL